MSFELKKVFNNLSSYFIALARLIIWTTLTFFSGLQRTLFTRSEVVGVELKIAPFRCDIKDTNDKLAYIDKLCLENPDLIVNNIAENLDSFDEDFGEDFGEDFDEDE